MIDLTKWKPFHEQQPGVQVHGKKKVMIWSRRGLFPRYLRLTKRAEPLWNIEEVENFVARKVRMHHLKSKLDEYYRDHREPEVEDLFDSVADVEREEEKRDDRLN